MEIERTYQSLNGPWRLALDPGDVGLGEGWFERGELPDAMEVTVPSVWDRWVPDYDGVGWYLRHFEVEEVWDEKCVMLRFEAADYYAEVWLNGHRLGDHEGGYTPFQFDVTKHLCDGENRLAVRVVDPHGEDGYGEFLPKEIPSAKEGGYWSFAGIWGDVTLEVKPVAHITDVFVQPDTRRKRLGVQVTASGPGTVRLQIEGTSFATEGEPGRLMLDFPDFELWSPQNPQCYTLLADLVQEDGSFDRHTVRFGMREFTVKDQRFYLNNRPLFIKAALHQPDYPRTLACPESPEVARREIELAKEAGFNMLRLHIKTAPRITLELADELGMLLYAEPPIGWIRNSEHMQRRCENEVREMILRDRNHPSVVIWGMLNESGNAGYVTGGGAQIIKNELCHLARALDPSRVIIDDSGGVNGTRESARLMRPYRDQFEEYDDLHIYQRAPVDYDIESYYRHSGSPGKLFFLSEFGFGGPEDLADVLEQYGDEKDTLKDARFIQKMLDASLKGFHERNLDRLFGDFAGLATAARELQCDAARLHIDAIRSNPKAGGYCYTQLCDAGHEFCAGVLDRWRRPKPVLETMKQVQASVRPIIQVSRTNLAPREEAQVTILLANEDRLEGRADLSLQVVGPTNQVLWKKKRSVKIPRHGKELWTGTVAASGSTGVHRFVVRLMQGIKVLAESAVELSVFEPLEPSEIGIYVLDPGAKWHAVCSQFAKSDSVLAPIHIIPPIANTIRAYPDNELMQIFAQVKGGAVALFFAPPEDWNDLAAMLDSGLEATPKDAVGGFLPACHYVKLHPVFDGLPSGGLMRQPYRNVVPPVTFLEPGDEDICGTYDTTPIAAGNYMTGETAWWGSDILVRRYGSGRVAFTHLRVLEKLGNDPVADRLFINMLNHFSRRSVPSNAPLAPNQRAVEWVRAERVQYVRRWMVIGEFPNWDGAGHDAAYAPEKEIDFGATYPGWYKAITWKPWYATATNGYKVNLQDAFSPVYEYYPRFDYGTGYAHAEFLSDRRQEATFRLGHQNAMKVWLNGALVYECVDQIPHDEFGEGVAEGLVRQGRNTVLVKCSKVPGPFAFSLDLEDGYGDPLPVKWWR